MGISSKVWTGMAYLFLTATFLFLVIQGSHKWHYSGWAGPDAQYTIAGRHFAQEGFVFHRFLPMVKPGFLHNYIPNNQPNGHYTHYPPLQSLLVGVIAKILPDHIHLGGKIFSSFVSTLALLFYFFFFRQFASGGIALMAILFIGLAPPYLKFADSLCNQPLDELFRALVFFLSVRLVSRWNRGCYLALWITLFLLAFNSVEYLPFAFFFVGFFLFKRLSWKPTLILLSSVILVWVLHLAQVIWEWGSPSGAWQDFFSIAINRIQGVAVGPHAHWATTYLGALKMAMGALQTSFAEVGFRPSIFLFVFGMGQLFLFLQTKKGEVDRRESRLFVSLFFGFSFLLLLPIQVLVIRSYVFRHFLPLIPLFLILTWQLLQGIVKRRTMASLAFLGIVLLVFNPVAYARSVKAYFSSYPNLVSNTSWGNMFELNHLKAFCSMQSQVEAMTRYGDVILFPAQYSPGPISLSELLTPLLENCWQRQVLVYRVKEMKEDVRELVKKLRDSQQHFWVKDPRVRSMRVFILAAQKKNKGFSLTPLNLEGQ